jgi:transcriptional regulator with GAF, ATPase, and Fis domain
MSIKEVFNKVFSKSLKPLFQTLKQNIALRGVLNKPDFSSLPPVPEAIRRQGEIKKTIEAVTNKFLSIRSSIGTFLNSKKTPLDFQQLFESILVQDPFSIEQTEENNSLALQSILACSEVAKKGLSLINRYQSEEIPDLEQQLVDCFVLIDKGAINPQERMALAQNYLNTAKELIQNGSSVNETEAQSLLNIILHLSISSLFENYIQKSQLLNKRNDKYDWACEEVIKQAKAHSELWKDLETFARKNKLIISPKMKKSSDDLLKKIKGQFPNLHF